MRLMWLRLLDMMYMLLRIIAVFWQRELSHMHVGHQVVRGGRWCDHRVVELLRRVVVGSLRGFIEWES